MLDEDGDDQEDGRDDDEPELFLQTMLVVMMLVLVFVRATLAMMIMFMRMCHILALFKFHGAKVRRFHCNSVAKYNYQEFEN